MTADTPFQRRAPEPLLIVISGPSGSGKDTAVQRMKDRGLEFHFVVTATTRPRRPGEVHGRDYWFVSKAEFDRMISQGELIEHAVVYRDYKGVPKAQVQQALASGRDVVLRLDVQGAETVRKLVPEALLIFILTDREEDLVHRLRERRTESPEDLEVRIKTIHEELQKVGLFDYLIVNHEDQIDHTVDVIMAIIEAEHHRVQQRKVSL